MNVESGEPLDNFTEETLKWAQSLGSQSTTVTQVISSQDPLVSIIVNTRKTNEKLNFFHYIYRFIKQ